MKKYIVTTTINTPTIATLKFLDIAKRDDWTFVVVGDTKTPHQLYENLQKTSPNNFVYLSPEFQEKQYKELSDIIGWKTIQRRNIGFVFAYKNGADIIATIDDDNIPYDNWGKEILVGKTIEVDYYENLSVNIFDPLSVTNNKSLWHRGYPIEYLNVKNDVLYKGKKHITPLIQADLWDGDPDIDAMCRLSQKPMVKFDVNNPYASSQLSPFNSQNTFIHRSIIKHYAVWPFVGRMDDIWGGYYLQNKIGTDKIIYNKASVYQDRNMQDLVTNLENEIIGYRNTLSFVNNPVLTHTFISTKTKEFFEIYTKQFENE